MRSIRWWIAVLAILAASTTAMAQHHDALTEKEADQLRETAQEPNKRLHLLVSFAKARMEAIDRLRSDKNMAAVQGEHVSDLLGDVASIVDEIDENLSSYDSKGEDVRKALREVVEMDTDFQLKLRGIKDTTAPEQRKMYSFAIDNATESVNSSADSARAMLDDENAKKGKEKIDKKEEENARKAKPPKDKNDRPDYTGMGIPKPK